MKNKTEEIVAYETANLNLTYTELDETCKAIRMAMGTPAIWNSLTKAQKFALEEVEFKIEEAIY